MAEVESAVTAVMMETAFVADFPFFYGQMPLEPATSFYYGFQWRGRYFVILTFFFPFLLFGV